MRPLAAALLAALAAAGCGERRRTEPPPVATYGTGARAVTILRPSGLPRTTVIFLHGWGGIPTRVYGPWLRHLVRGGSVVVYPRYQTSFATPPTEVLPNVLAAVRTASRHVRIDPRHLVVAGHSAGGALAADYAALAPEAGLARPRAVLAAYPGRAARGLPGRLPDPGAGSIPAGTRIVALAGADDRTVGTTTARAIVAGARRVPRARRRYVLVRDPRVDDHLGPQRAGAPSRRAFWARLDGLLLAVR